jgi:hypothetical protein
VTRDGVEQATFEGVAFTISTDTRGTLIASTGEVTITVQQSIGVGLGRAPERVVSIGKFEARFPPDRTTWMARTLKEGSGSTWRLYGQP